MKKLLALSLIFLLSTVSASAGEAQKSAKKKYYRKADSIIMDCVQNLDNIRDKEEYLELGDIATKIKVVLKASDVDSDGDPILATALVSSFFRFTSVNGEVTMKQLPGDKTELTFTSNISKKLSVVVILDENQKKNIIADGTLYKIEASGDVKLSLAEEVTEEMSQVHTCTSYGWDD